MIGALLAVLITTAPIDLKPWEPGNRFSAADRLKMQLSNQVEAETYALEGLDTYDRWAMDDATLLGDLLFHSPQLLGPKAAVFGLSCDTCHPGGGSNGDFFVEAQSDVRGNVDLLSDYFYPEANDGVFAPRNITTLRGASLTAPYRRDGSAATLKEANAFVMGHEFQQTVPTPWLEALTAYIARFTFLPTPAVPVNAAIRAGEKVFLEPRAAFEGKSCATCHDPKNHFSDGAQHALRHGEGKNLGHTTRFDTPVLTGLSETAPYFFDGSGRTIPGAVAIIDRRHGLKLTAAQQASLAAWLDAIGAVETKPTVWAPEERVRQALAWARLAKDDALWPIALGAIQVQLRLALRKAKTPKLVELDQGLAVLLQQAPDAAARAKLDALAQGVGVTLTSSLAK